MLFRQKRYGFNNERIEVLKFRSMYTDMADANGRQGRDQERPAPDPGGTLHPQDQPRRTATAVQVFSRAIYRWSARARMPCKAKLESRLFDEAVDGYFARHRVKPGMTGWAQINGWRGEIDTTEKIQKRVEFDLYYIENWSVLFDLYILLKTPLALMTKSENAY